MSQTTLRRPIPPPRRGADIVPIGSRAPVKETLPPAVQRVVEEIQPEKIILFGSYAYGEPTPDSDVDLLVIWDTQTPYWDRGVKVSMLMYPREFPLDVLVRTPAEVAAAIDAGDFFIEEIYTQGQILYEHDGSRPTSTFIAEPVANHLTTVRDPASWTRRAENFYALARSALRHKRPGTYGVCYYAYQCASTYLMALLIAADRKFSYTRNLTTLHNLCIEAGTALPIEPRKLLVMDTQGVEAKHPDFDPSIEVAEEAFTIAKEIRSMARQLLGLRNVAK